MIELGSTVKDVVTGFEGVVTARYIFLYGCERYCVQPAVKKDDKTNLPKEKTFDEPQLKVIKKPTAAFLKTLEPSAAVDRPGGPVPYAPDSKDP